MKPITGFAGSALTICAAMTLGGHLLVGGAYAQSEGWSPERNVEYVVPLASGGGTDLATRQLQKIIDDHALIPQSMTVVNKPGGSGSLGYIYVQQHEGDAHYVGVGMVTLYTNALQGKHSLTYDDLTLITRLYSEPTSFFVREESEIKTAEDLLARLKDDPASVTIGLNSIGGGHHLAIAQIVDALGKDPLDLKIVTFNSAGENAVAVRGGHVDVGVASAATGVSQLKAGGMRVIAVAAAERMSGALSEVPTWREKGIDVVAENWRGVVAPPGITEDQVAYWVDVFEKLAETPEFKKMVEENGWSANVGGGPAEFRSFIEASEASDRKMLERLGLVE